MPAATKTSTALGHYTDRWGRRRELAARAGSGGSTLVVDRDASTGGECRVVAHLASDEPPGNAELIARRYLEDGREERSRCRLLIPEHDLVAPFGEGQPDPAEGADASAPAFAPLDGRAFAYRLELVEAGMSIPELRWRRNPPPALPTGRARTVSVRAAVGLLECYEPVCALTVAALAEHGDSDLVSTTVLRAELERLRRSPIVLNRGLREHALAAVARGELSMSEIAMRCGRVKRDSRGNQSGETSWLARRLGLLPEGGQRAPTPWVHTDVLALIARRGLGMSPREVEVE